MTLVELILALSIAATMSLVIGHIVSQMITGGGNLEARSQVQTEAALAILRMRSELRHATKFSEFVVSRVVFTHPDVTGDNNPDQIIYEWSGTAGDPITRQVNQSDPAPILQECRAFSMSTTIQNMVLEAGKSYDIKLEYYENTGSATVWLYWASASTSTQTIPQSRLIPAIAGIPPASGSGGLTGQYYNDMNLNNLILTRTDPNVQFDWGWGSTDFDSDGNNFSVRWTGKVVPQYSEVYTFYTQFNNGARLWVDNQLIIDKWFDNATGDYSGIPTTPITLVEVHIEAGSAYSPVRMDTSVQCVNKPRLETTN